MSPRSASAPRRTVLRLEQLETRQVLSAAQPTAVEQLFLEQLNDIRANPAVYGTSIGLDLSNVAPSQPLALDPVLTQAARTHSQDMSDRGYFAHNTPEGLNPGQQMQQAGAFWNAWGQSIAAGTAYPTPAAALKALIIDAGVPDLGHRMHLLAVTPIFQRQVVAGTGIVQDTAGPYANYYTLDTSDGFTGRHYLTGSVINDVNGNGRYDVGEGLGGVTITVAGIGRTTSFAAGGYSIAVPPGRYTVTASGGGLAAPVTQVVSVGMLNTRLTIRAGAGSTGGTPPRAPTVDPAAVRYVQHLYQQYLGRTAAAAEANRWAGVVQGPAGPLAAAAGIEFSPEARTRRVAGWYQQFLGRAPAGGEEQQWVGVMLRGGTEEDALAGLLSSDEYLSHAGGMSGFVRSLYEQLLGRTAAPTEVQGWLSRANTSDRDHVAAAFLHSAEYRGRTVTGYYADVLHRQSPPTRAEVNGWAATALALADIRVRFDAAPEALANG